MSNATKLDELTPEKRRLLALRLKSRKSEESGPVPAARDGGEYPLSFAQQRLWFIDRMDPGSAVYTMPAPLRLRGPLDVPALERALGEVVRRHQALRTRFPAVDGHPVQHIEPAGAFHLPIADLATLSVNGGAGEDDLARYVAGWWRLPWDLQAGPPFRVQLVRVAPDDHLLLAAMHHIVSDGWSFGVFWGEVSALYHAFRAGQPSPLPELPIQYADYAVWQRAWLIGERLERQVAWWREHLAGAPALLEFPTDRPRPATQSHRGAAVPVHVPAEVAEPLRALAGEHGATLFMALLAAFGVLLSRWSGQDDVVVGTPVAGRTRRETEGLIGFFINTLPIRTDLGDDPSFAALLGRVREATLGAFGHQEVPFEKLVEEIQPGRTLSHTPIYQVMFVLQNTPPAAGEGFGGELRLEGAPLEAAVSKVDATLNLMERPDGSVQGVIEYATDLFDSSTIERMARHLGTLLRAAVRHPASPVSALEMMDDAEQAAVRAMGAAAARHPSTDTLHGWFARQAARTPDAVALSFAGWGMTYAELDAAADRLAARLRTRGAGPESLVGLCVERSMETVVGILGILKAGAAYLPLDPAYPDDRLAYMLEDSGAQLVVTAGDAAGRLPPGVERVRLDADDPADQPPLSARNERGGAPGGRGSIPVAEPGTLAPQPPPAVLGGGREATSGRGRAPRAESSEARSDSPLSARNERGGAGGGANALAYVIYTSGSTGRPKGVQVTHANVVRLMTATEPWFRFGLDDVWTLFHSYAFDFSVWEIWGALLYGGRLVVVPFSVSRDPAAFLRLLADERVTVLNQTPSAFRQLIRADEDAAAAGGAPELALREVVFGGEALDPASLRPWVERRGADRPRLVNMYGITETTVHVTFRVIGEEDVRAGSASPIGIAIPDLSVHLLDRRGQPVPLGVAGEMYVGGGGVARGYLGRPSLTAQRFVPDPFSAEAGGRLYRSGDLARRRADGSLEFLGRADDQVKVRGFRIELGEIESVLLEHPAVREAVVLVRGAGDERRLVAWVVAGAVTAAELRAHLLERLPDYMAPSATVFLDRLPLTRNGKVDRRALPEPEAADLTAAEYVEPWTETERVLAALWAELLGVARVGRTDGFFDLGGHSLLATRVVARVREALGIEVPVRALFEHPVLQAFAEEVERVLRASTGTEAPPIRPAAREGDAPLSFAQERLWFVDRMEPGSPVYHMPFHYLLRGPLDADALRRALDEIVRRHEILRTSLPFTGEQPAQRVHPPAPVDLPIHDLRVLADDERHARADAVMHDVATRAFDLERGPLFRAALVRMADDEHVLALNLHHVISDGWSTGVLWNELSALYAAYVDGKPSPLAELPIQYADFAVWQRAWLAGEVLEAQLAYWRRKLAGAPPLLELPTDRARPAAQTYAGAAESILLPLDDAQAVHALGRREGATLFMVLLAAMNVVFSRLAGQDDVVIGTPIAGRTRRETEGLIGLFLNSLALRADLSGEPTFRQLLRRVRETTLEAYAHQDLPFERILEELAPERSLSHSPLFQVMLNLQNFAEGDVALAGLQVQPVAGSEDVASKFDLTLYAGEGPDGIVLHLVYNVALFDAPRVRGMLAQLAGLLRQVAEDVDQPIHRYSLLTEDAAAVLPDPAVPLGAEWRGSVPALFAAHASRTPDAVAVEDIGERWTYAELHADTDAIARRLIADGVQPGEVVAILGHRGAALVRALIGAMKAGGAFLVLDPAYPPSRLAEYVRIARPTGFLPIEAAGAVPPELADALRETVVSIIPLSIRPARIIDKVADGIDPSVHDEVLPLSRAAGEGAGGRGPSRTQVDAGRSTPFPEIGPDSLAYLSFTSGTTGTPKAVMGRHGSLTHFTPWLAERFELRADDRFSLLSGLAHDPLHRDVFTPLQLGAAVVAPDPDQVGTPGYLARWMRGARITVAHLTPAMGQLLTSGPEQPSVLGKRSGRSLEPSEAHPNSPLSARSLRGEGPPVDSLRRAFFVGDVLTRTDVARMYRLAPNLQVINYYGSTETQRAVAHFIVPRDLSELAKETIPVGTGIPDVQVLIRNAAGERVGIGEVGEMWMRSPHVALGYLGDPELTATRFVPNPWTGDAADPAYRTGDLGRYRPDGVAEIAGRADQQVKIRGFRIEPGEVEAVLRAHPSIRDTVVAARGEGEDKRLVAYVVAEGEPPAAGVLRDWLRAGVPDYMLPAAWVFLPALPVTPNGKIDRKALPDPEAAAEHTFTPPRTATERAVAEIWAEVLGVAADGIAVDADFFALGGHSLRVTQVLSRIRARLGAELPIRAFFTAPTVAALAAAINAQSPASTEPAVSPESATEPAESPLSHSRTPALSHFPPGVYPLSFAQQRLWVLMQLGGTTGYHLASALRMTGALDAWALERALDEIVRRHQTLRMKIETRGGEPVQVVQPPRPLRLRVEDVRPGEGESVEDALRRMAEDEAARPFPAEGPFLRVRLLRAADDDHVLLWTLHHVMADGWSLGVFQGELLALYRAFATDTDAELPPLQTQYGEHALAQRRELSGAALDRLAEWWMERLAGAPALLELPTDHPRPAVPSGEGESFWFAFPEGTAERVGRVARERGATPFMVLLAAFQALLSRWSGQDDVVVGTPIANRTRPELEPLIGFFANTLALRGDLSGAPSFDVLLARVRETTLGAYEHQDVPFERLVEELNPERSLSHAPVFQVMFALQNAPRAEGGAPLEGLTLSDLPRRRETAQFDLSLALYETGDGLAARLEYATDLFAAASMERFAAQLVHLLDAALDDPARPVAALPLMDDAERARLLAAPAGPTAPYPAVPPHALFRMQAERTPHAVALVSGDERMTYAELAARASAVARRLLAAGVRPGEAVAVLAEHSPDAVAALLGVMMAGGAFLPLDPEAPAERLAFTLDDARAAAVLAQPHLADRLPTAAGPVVPLTAEGDGGMEAVPALPEVHPASLAYVLYTSGSTGRPKGVGVSHRALAAHLASCAERHGLTPRDRTLAFAAPTFDPWLEQVLAPLCAGASVALRDPRVWSAAELAEAVQRLGITVVNPPTAYWHHLVDDAPSAAAVKRAARLVIAGGEAMSPDAAARWSALPGDAVLLNAYGPTEAVVTALAWEVDGAVAVTAARLPVGVPLAGRVARVLDGRGEPVPVGVPGELYLGGPALADGYRARPALTAAAFVPDPFSATPGARMYRTGDRARWRADGTLEYLGRADHQVKVRGFRIEPGEIEAALKRHPSIADAVVVAGQGQDARLAAYLTPREGATVPGDAELREGLARSLPAYMVPSAFVPLDAIPLTPGGKVDRRALPVPGAPAGGGYVMPRELTELEVARIWADALGVERVGATDDFFRLGGHSLLAVRMMVRVRERFGRDLPLATLFHNPTVAAFAQALRRGGAGADQGRLLVALNPGGTRPPLTFFPPAGGTVTGYAELARLLGPDQPFLALHAPGLTGAEPPLESVEALAERMVDEIRAAQPRGPYWLGGWSAGGTLGYHAARLLRAAGQEVALLALIDTTAPDGAHVEPVADRVELFRRFVQANVTEDQALLDGLVDELRALPEAEQIAGLARWMARHGGQAMDEEVERIGRSLTVFAATHRAVRAYLDPPPLDVPIALFVAAGGKAENAMGPDVLPGRWRPFAAAGLAVRVVPGIHAQLVMDPAVRVLAEHLRQVLEETRAGSPAG